MWSIPLGKNTTLTSSPTADGNELKGELLAAAVAVVVVLLPLLLQSAPTSISVRLPAGLCAPEQEQERVVWVSRMLLLPSILPPSNSISTPTAAKK